MKDILHTLEVISRHGIEHVRSRAEDADGTCLDVWVLGLTEPNLLSRDASDYMQANMQRILAAGGATFRLLNIAHPMYTPAIDVSRSFLCGSAIRISPSFLFSNHHVAEYLFPMFSPAESCAATSQALTHRDLTQASMVDNLFETVVLAEVQPTRPFHGLDPVFGPNNKDFSGLDLFVTKFKGDINAPHVLFVPSARALATGDSVICLSFPGHEETHQPFTRVTECDQYIYRHEPADSTTMFKAFAGYGKKTASYGRVITGFGLVNNEWTEHNIVADTSTEHYIPTNQSVLPGSSGGALLPGDFRMEFAVDRNGVEWTLVEYAGIHFGGEFIPCSSCFKHPDARREMKPALIKGYSGCQACKEKKPVPIAYNYAISVHHKLLVDSYNVRRGGSFAEELMTMFPSVPPLIRAYYEVHKI